MENIERQSAHPCSGCGGCAAVCPKQAITMKLDTAGFYRAQVQRDLCADCGLCTRVCYRLSGEHSGVSLYDVPLYALQSADENTVRRCSSGGIAHELSLQTIRAGGKAAGAVYDTKTNTVRHEIISQPEEIARLDGSKYLQSCPDAAFREILREAQKTRFAVFGTPCQIAALSRAAELLGVREQLLLVEIFCHGVPSYRAWETELESVRRKLGTDRFENVRFRYKKDDWHSYCLRIDGGGRTFYGKRETDLFWQVFFENILLGDACQNCQARKAVSQADLRLGDYWGSRFRQRSDGVSAVFACTERGREAVGRLLAAGAVRELTASDAAEMLAAQNMDGYHNQQLHDEAMACLRREGTKKAVACYRSRQSGKQKLKRQLLRLSVILPDNLRARLRKANSGRKTRKIVNQKAG